MLISFVYDKKQNMWYLPEEVLCENNSRNKSTDLLGKIVSTIRPKREKMKPSEYLNMPYTNEKGSFQKIISGIELKELDKRFIDREELKDKINEIDIWNKNGLKVKKEILELLK